MGNKEIVEGVYGAFARGDVPAVLGAMASDIQWNEAEGFPLYDGTFIGPDEVLNKVFMRLGEIGPNFAAVPDQIIADGDTVVAIGNYSWDKATGDGREQVKMVHVWTVADGKLSAFQQHTDTARVNELIAG
jgi:ketosteroid isomerase-like protein